MKLVKEFREFALKGNVMDMAVGIIIGLAFGKIVSSFVADIIMPPLGLLIGGVDFTDLHLVMKAAVGEDPAVTLNYGTFIQAIVDFLIIAFAVFMVIKAMNSARRKRNEEPGAPPAPPELTKEEILLTEIRDLLKRE